VAIEFNCPHCGKLLTTTESRAHALAKCPACGDLITVPAVSDPEPLASSSVRNPEFAATAAWGNAPTPGPMASPAPGFAPSGNPPVGSQHFQAPIAPPIDGHAVPGDGRAAVSVPVPAAPPLPGAAVGEVLARDSVATQGPQAYRPPTPRACPQCGYPAAPGAIYCAVCGVPLVPAAYPLRFAGFWSRSFAEIIDLTIVGLAAGALERLLPRMGWEVTTFFLWFVYNAALESSREQATIGKRALGMFVCGADGRRLTFARAGIRTLAKLLSFAICGMGFVMPLLTPKKQALHDLMTDAVVVLS
jgi:uncharacterized RDD family membrane protein YckC